MALTSTSGDLLADRRFNLGVALAAEGDHAAAADLFEQTLERVPEWAPAWLALGLAREKEGLVAEAIAALRRAGAHDPADALGAALHVARLVGEPSASTMSPAFVRNLFDHYADRFDAHLVEALRYRGPALIVAALDRLRTPSFAEAIDLGCGTGLMARALAGRVGAIDGVDLAPRMVERAARTGLYRDLAVAEIGSYLAGADAGRFDLVVAADVLVYLGALETLFADVARVLRAGGIFAFTVQALESGPPYALGEDMRFSHDGGYIAQALTAAGLQVVSLEQASTREDRGVPVPGLVGVARNT